MLVIRLFYGGDNTTTVCQTIISQKEYYPTFQDMQLHHWSSKVKKLREYVRYPIENLVFAVENTLAS